jgi:hypothetical protein
MIQLMRPTHHFGPQASVAESRKCPFRFHAIYQAISRLAPATRSAIIMPSFHLTFHDELRVSVTAINGLKEGGVQRLFESYMCTLIVL